MKTFQPSLPSMLRAYCLLCLVLVACGSPPLEDRPVTLDELTIEVFGPSREVGYTNKEAGFFYTETSAEHRTGWQGWHVMSKKILDDYLIAVDGRPLRKSDVHLSHVAPHQIRRAYPSGVQETVTLLDSVDAMVIELDQVKGDTVSFSPLFSDALSAEDFETGLPDGVALIARKHHLKRTAHDDYPVWIGLAAEGAESPSQQPEVRKGRLFGPTGISVPVHAGHATLVLVAGDTKGETAKLGRDIAGSYKDFIRQRKDRMERLLNAAYLRTNDETLDKAAHWAMLSLDALIMNQRSKGIFAGLPWFSNYWGRDSFISLPGATLVTGNFADAREILRSFARWQDTKADSKTFGRIPNLVTTNSISYNTADGTPWFVIALEEYVNYSGDRKIVRELFPVVRRSIEGTLKHHVERKTGLLTHEDAETWMDAVGPNGPWSPRGNRANDIQALWYKQLLIGSWLAEMAGDRSSFQRWVLLAEQVRNSFNELYLDSAHSQIADHLNPDGTADGQLRPNQLFALDLIGDLNLQRSVFANLTSNLVYPHGVASLSQLDENFHPYHHYEPNYVQDAAYHNGIVWTWLAGPWIDAATRLDQQDLAYELTASMAQQILERGAVGTLSELLDAAPRKGEAEPRLSGTFSQAWSLAEFIRTLHQDYLGVSVDAPRGKLELHPHLPSSITQASFNIPFGQHMIRARYVSSPVEGKIVLQTPPALPPAEVVVTWQLRSGVEHNFVIGLGPSTTTTLTLSDDNASGNIGEGERSLRMHVKRTVPPDSAPPLKFATPVIRTDLKALRGPSHRMLNHSEVTAKNPGARLLYEATDPLGDDKGKGSYSYPTTPNLKPGSLDLAGIRITADDKNAYFSLRFRTLSNPGWHPEYGFQLTFAAIAIDKDGKAGSGQTVIGRNAKARLPAQFAYETIVYGGGGVRVEDASENVLAEYLPASGDEQNPIGNAAAGAIEFALPVDLIGTPGEGWNITVLAGAQDDHGGSGLGEFRSVQAKAGEWVGGGKKRSSDPNVYDILPPRSHSH